ncbi:MAG: N-acetylmuramoyl-L-alanine amidase [Clostridia bacterium]|nr:N-acetylmuramoyl-L-alanine amidase [Clostridia bacterium]
MRKLICMLLVLCFLPVMGQAAATLSVVPGEAGFSYTVTGTENWIRLTWKSGASRGMKTLYSADGCFEGEIELPYNQAGGRYTVAVENMKATQAAKTTVNIPAAVDYESPTGLNNAKVQNLILEETAEGFRYSFLAPGTDYMMLYFRSIQEEACFPVYPVNADGLYEGEVVSDLTYARTLFKVEIRNANGNTKKSGEVRKAYEAPEEPMQQQGRLSGVVVCIDPGHHENHQPFKEGKGPGLEGTVNNSGGMAQGLKTLRRESIVTLEAGMVLRDLLIAEGATVVMTRHAVDDFITNIGRCDVAEAAGAHIMLRLHCNMNENRNKTGIQVYGPLNSDYAKAVADKATYRTMGQLLLDEMKKATGFALEEKTGRVALNDDYVGNNWAKMTCFLVEMGYMSNIGEDIKLATPEYQTMLAEGMVEGIYQIALYRGWIN